MSKRGGISLVLAILLLLALAFASIAHAVSVYTQAHVVEMVKREAERQGVPVRFAVAIARTESDFRAFLIGDAAERGPLQLLPSTARWLGFKGTWRELENPEINIPLAMRYLALAWNEADGDPKMAALKYNRGIGRPGLKKQSCWPLWDMNVAYKNLPYECRVLMNVE